MIRLFILLAFIFIMMFIICGKNDYDKCYSDMEYRGCAAMNCCGGLSGGTKNTGYLSETCIGCPYLVTEYDFKDIMALLDGKTIGDPDFDEYRTFIRMEGEKND